MEGKHWKQEDSSPFGCDAKVGLGFSYKRLFRALKYICIILEFAVVKATLYISHRRAVFLQCAFMAWFEPQLNEGWGRFKMSMNSALLPYRPPLLQRYKVKKCTFFFFTNCRKLIRSKFFYPSPSWLQIIPWHLSAYYVSVILFGLCLRCHQDLICFCHSWYEACHTLWGCFCAVQCSVMKFGGRTGSVS